MRPEVALSQFPAVVGAIAKMDADLEGMDSDNSEVEARLETLHDRLALAFSFYAAMTPEGQLEDRVLDSAITQTEIAEAYGFDQHAVGVYGPEEI